MSRLFAASLAAVSLMSGLSAFASARAAEPEPPEALTWMALKEINEAYFNRAEPMNRPALVTRLPDGMIRAVDVSRDGKPDWLVDYSGVGTGFCGTGGCLQTLYVSDGDAYVLAFDEQALEFEVAEVGGEARVEAQVHHTFCVPDDWDCSYAFAWDPGLLRLVERPNARGVTLLTSGLEPIGERDGKFDPDALPVEMAEVWRTSRVTCPTTNNDDGLEVRRAFIRSVPDLNGDDRRDWIATAPYACIDPESTEETPLSAFAVYVSQGESLVKAYESAPGVWAATDIASRPARLRVGPPCGYGTECRFETLTWNAQAGRLETVD